MFHRAALLAFTLCAVVRGQQVGTITAETHPALSVQECTSSGSCTTQQSIVLDSNWRWLHDISGYTTGNNCSTSSGVPEDVESQSPNSQVVFSNIKYGPIGSTF
ncbi:CBH1_1 [Sanghuangporus weigelae]